MTRQQYNDLDHDQLFPNQRNALRGITKARKRLGLDQEWVAEQAGYSTTQYIRIENGERKIWYNDIWRIGRVLADYQESLQPAYKRWFKELIAPFRRAFFQVKYWLEDL